MAVPKKKTSRHRKGKRRSHHHLSMPPMARCGRCGGPVKPHAVCDRCGHYLKTIHQPEAQRLPTPPLLPAERLLTPGLDLLAAQEGYTRPIGIGQGLSDTGKQNGRGN